MNPSKSCCCSTLHDTAVIPIGALDDLDERVFARLVRVKVHGGFQWWLYASRCDECGQHWLVAQDERIHDNYYLKRLKSETALAIIDEDRWPDDFLTYAEVLKLGIDSGKVCSFVDQQSSALIETASDLRRECPKISVEEIAHLLAISPEAATRLR